MDRDAIVRTLSGAGCIAPGAEADELTLAAGGDAGLLDGWVARRTEGEPISWLTGKVTFCELELAIEPGVYVPRLQTEPLARRAAALLPPTGRAADICTGMGAIAAVMAAAKPNARVVATELDPAAARCARGNGIEVFEGSLCEPLPRDLRGRVDVMTAVAPYVPTGALRLLPRDVQKFEPRRALDGGSDGCDFLSVVVRQSIEWLRPGGRLLLEFGGDQVESVGSLMRSYGFEEPTVLFDDDGDPRGSSGRHAF